MLAEPQALEVGRAPEALAVPLQLAAAEAVAAALPLPALLLLTVGGLLPVEEAVCRAEGLEEGEREPAAPAPAPAEAEAAEGLGVACAELLPVALLLREEEALPVLVLLGQAVGEAEAEPAAAEALR